MLNCLDLSLEYNWEPSNWCGGLISRHNAEAGDPGEAVIQK